MRLEPVPAEFVADVWSLVAPWVEAMCERPECTQTADELRMLCAAARAALVIIMSGERPVAACITQVRDHADGTRSCWVLALAGSRAGPWPEVIAQVEAGAKRNGCHRVEFIGRPGWARLLPGYEVEAYFRKEIA